MYMAHSRFGAARTSYRDTQLAAIQGASPHRLVAILFDEAIKSLEATAAAANRRDWSQLGTHQARALSIISGLETSLDMSAGEVAANLAAVYREVRRLTLQGGRSCDAGVVMQARGLLAEIAEAWEAIA